MDDEAVSEAMEPVALEVARADVEAAFVVVRDPVARPLAENEPVADDVELAAAESLATTVAVMEAEEESEGEPDTDALMAALDDGVAVAD